MKLLCFSDLHRDQQAATSLVQAAADVDCVIGAGDFANRHEGLPDTLDILAAIEKPAILVPGNGESAAELTEAAQVWKSATVLHGSGCVIDGIQFWGVGGAIPVTPFGAWSYDFDEQQGADMLSGCPAGGVLVVHSPPLDTVDKDRSGRIRGSESIRQTILDRQPQLVVCGHIHDDWGKQAKLGKTRIFNAGPQGLVIDLNDQNNG